MEQAGPLPNVRTYETLAEAFHRNQEQQTRLNLLERSQALAENFLRIHR